MTITSLLFLWVLAAAPQADDVGVARASGIRAGLCVVLGWEGEDRMVALDDSPEFLVHALDPDADRVEQARTYLRKRNLYGRASAQRLTSPELPYSDGIVNLLVVEDPARLLKAVKRGELMRVLRPGGVLALRGVDEKDLDGRGIGPVQKRGPYVVAVRPRPEGLDEWTHADYDASGIAVSKDTAIAPLEGLRWVAGPEWPLGLYYQVGNGGMVAGGGRLFSVTINVAENLRKDPLERDRSYHLVARDAFNGLLLWSRPLPHRAPREGTSLAHALVAGKDRVFVVIDGDLLAVDAATGKEEKIYARTDSDENRLALEGKVLVLGGRKQLRAFEADGGKELWTRPLGVSDLLIHRDRVFVTTPRRQDLVGLELKTGRVLWTTDLRAHEGPKRRLLFAARDFLVYVGMKSYKPGSNWIAVYEAADGRLRWRKEYDNPRAHWPESVHFLNGAIHIRTARDRFEGLDPKNGASVRTLAFKGSLTGGCMRNVATERYLVGTRPFNLIDLETGSPHEFRGGRHACRAGVTIANGMLYSLPHGCKCVSSTIRGFLAFAPKGPGPTPSPERLETGPAAGAVEPGTASPTDWPTFRHDARRTGRTTDPGPRKLSRLWETRIEAAGFPPGPLGQEWRAASAVGEILTGPVVAEGVVVVGSVQSHRVSAVDPETGNVRWSFTAGGRLDTPPTLYRGLCLFGCRDGFAYALRLTDGALVWKFRAAPADRRMVAFGQLESVWPVVGGVTVADGKAYLVAGRSGAVDGGLRAYALDPASGKILWKTGVPDGGRSDLGVKDGDSIYLGRLLRFGAADGKRQRRGIDGLFTGSNRILDRAWETLSADDRATHWMRLKQGFGAQKPVYMGGIKHKFQPGEGSLVVAAPEKRHVYAYRVRYIHWNVKKNERNELGGTMHAWEGGKDLWAVTVPDDFQAESLVLAGNRLFAAGPVDRFRRKAGGRLWVLSAGKGELLEDVSLDVRPVSEGLAVAEGRLYVSLEDGRLVSFGVK